MTADEIDRDFTEQRRCAPLLIDGFGLVRLAELIACLKLRDEEPDG
jgi:hypothetical protein